MVIRMISFRQFISTLASIWCQWGQICTQPISTVQARGSQSQDSWLKKKGGSRGRGVVAHCSEIMLWGQRFMTVVTIAFCICAHVCMDWTAWENTVNKYFNSHLVSKEWWTSSVIILVSTYVCVWACLTAGHPWKGWVSREPQGEWKQGWEGEQVLSVMKAEYVGKGKETRGHCVKGMLQPKKSPSLFYHANEKDKSHQYISQTPL